MKIVITIEEKQKKELNVATRVSLKESGFGDHDSTGRPVFTQEESLYRWRNRGSPRCMWR